MFFVYSRSSFRVILFAFCLFASLFFNFIELNRLYTTQLTVVNLQLVTSAKCFGPIWPSSGLQRLVAIKVHNVAVPFFPFYLLTLFILQTFVCLCLS